MYSAVDEGFTGYNVDFEPTSKATPADAVAYAKFIDQVRAIFIFLFNHVL